jgi:hypothetical protein
LPKLQPEIVDLCMSDGDSDGGCDCDCVHAFTREFDSKEGVLTEDDDDCVDVTSEFAAPLSALTTPMNTSSKGGVPAGLPNISLHDEVHHLVRAVQQVRALPNASQ